MLTLGCAVPSNLNDYSRHYIMIHKEGHPLNANKEPVGKRNDDVFEKKYIGAIIEGIDRHVKQTWNLKGQSETARILLFVHGGLNPYEVGLNRIEKMVKIQDGSSGVLLGSSYYPLFIVWNSSLLSSWWDDLFLIRRGGPNPWWAIPTSPLVFMARIADGVLTAPVTYPYMAMDTWDSFTRSVPEEDEKEDKRVLAVITYFGLLPVRPFLSPAVKAAGTPAWEIMKRRADLALARTLRRKDNPYARQGAAYTFMQALKERISGTEERKAQWKTKDGQTGPVAFTLVGHSMGTLILDKILSLFSEIHFERIIYLASASSINGVETVVFPYLAKHGDTEFWSFSLSRGDEAREGLGILERGSLLVWIDNYFERVRTPGQLRFGRYSNLEEYKFLEKYKTSLQLEVVKFSGEKGDPKIHGDFGKPEFLRMMLRRLDPDAFRPLRKFE